MRNIVISRDVQYMEQLRKGKLTCEVAKVCQTLTKSDISFYYSTFILVFCADSFPDVNCTSVPYPGCEVLGQQQTNQHDGCGQVGIKNKKHRCGYQI